jgi:hypothetical protein
MKVTEEHWDFKRRGPKMQLMRMKPATFTTQREIDRERLMKLNLSNERLIETVLDYKENQRIAEKMRRRQNITVFIVALSVTALIVTFLLTT